MSSKLFARIPHEVIQDDRLTLRQIKVLIAIISFANQKTGQCNPSRKQLSERCKIRETTISIATTELEELGWLKKIGMGGKSRSCDYIVTIPELSTVTRPEKQDQTILETSTVEGDETVPENVTVHETSTVHDLSTPPVPELSTPPVPDSSTRTIENRLLEQINEQIKTKKSKSEFILPDWLPSEIWQEWEAHRRFIKAPLSDKARSLGIATLEKLMLAGNDPVTVINRSIENSWKGFFELKTSKNNNFNNSGGSIHDRRAATLAAMFPDEHNDTTPDSGFTINATYSRSVD